MHKLLLVLRNEIINTITRPSFLFTALGLPLILALVFVGISALQGDRAGPTGSLTGSSDPTELESEGYVDLAQLIRTIPPDLPAGTLVAYPDEASAFAALQEGEISAYYIVPADYQETGEFVYVHPEANPIEPPEQRWVMRWVLLVNLLDGDIERAARVWNPMDLEERTLAPQQTEIDEDSPAAFFIPYATTLLLYIVILLSASLLLNSVNNERKNRVIEILLNSINSQQLLGGKIIGLGIAGLIQTLIWISSGYLLLKLGGQRLELPPGFEIPLSSLVWAVVFFLLGYAVYASLMAGMGALIPNLKEASQATFVVIVPLIVPLTFSYVIIEDIHGTLSVVLSLFPLTAPVTMMTRLVAGGVPWWQPVLAMVLLLGTAIVIVRAVARMFRAQTLLSGQPFSVKRFFSALLRGE
jgi:ABC-2 type transport system permease protein